MKKSCGQISDSTKPLYKCMWTIFYETYQKVFFRYNVKDKKDINSLFIICAEKCPVYLKLPWIGNVSSKFENQISKAITSCYYAVKPRVVYNTRVMLPPAKKDCVPTTQKSCVVYEFSYRYEARYVGRTTQRLANRIKQHVLTSTRKKSNTVREQPPLICKKSNSKINFEPAIGQHLIANPELARTYTDDNFRLIGQARSSFHLSVLESVYIKTQNPVLCSQKEFVFSLGLFK